MPDQPPKWCLLLDEWLARAEHELKELEKGTASTAPYNTPSAFSGVSTYD